MDSTTRAEEGRRTPLATVGGGCSCGCCGPTDATTEPVDRQREIAELRELREATERRLAELDAE